MRIELCILLNLNSIKTELYKCTCRTIYNNIYCKIVNVNGIKDCAV